MNPGTLSKIAAGLAESTLPVGARCVLLSLAAASGPDAVAWISAARLAKRCGVSTSTARRHLKTLTAAGLISVKERPGYTNGFTVGGSHPDDQGGCSPSDQGGTHPGDQGGSHPGEHRSSYLPRYIPKRGGGLRGRPLGNPTPATAYHPPEGGKSLREHLRGSHWKTEANGTNENEPDIDLSPLATVDERTHHADREPEGDQQAVPDLAANHG